MKKITLLILLSLLSSYIFGIGWFQDYILISKNAQTPTYYWIGTNPNFGTELNGTNFGTINSLFITGADMKYWAQSANNRTGGAFYYIIKDGSTTIKGPIEVIWNHASIGGNDYQGTITTEIDLITGLEPSKNYKLHIYAKSWGDGGDSWLSNNGNNYVADFTTPTSSASDYFRTKSPGIWSTNNIWESSTTGANSWVNATSSPTATAASILIAHNITISSNLTAGNSTINTGASLIVNPNIQFSTGTLTNNGTLTLKSDANGTATLLNSGTVSGSGIYNVEQYLAHARNWYVSSPLTAANVPTSGYNIHRRNEADATWDPVSSGTFTPGLGYVALPTAAGATLTFSGGTINTGNVAVALTKSGAISNGFNLIGNPYPAHLTWLKAFTDENVALIEPTIWYRTNAGTANNSGQWSFQTFNAFIGEGVPSSTTGKIPPMQAFWVRAKTAGTLTLNSTLTRSHETGNPLKAPKVEQMPKVRLQMSNEVYTDELLLYFNENASDGFDAYDSRKMFINNTVSEFYTLAENEKLVINGRQHLLDNTIVPLGINIANTGNYVIRANEISNIPTNMQVLLRDNVTSEDFDLQNSEGKTLTLNKENEISRYSLVFKVVGGTTDTQLANTKDWQIEKIGSNVFTARVSNTNNKPSRLVVYNGLGQKVQDIGFATESISFSLSTKGVYHIKLINNGVESVKSFVY